jgi:hypothetical protein
VSIIEHELIGILRQARRLLFDWLVEAFLVKLHAQRAGKKDGSIMQRLRILGATFNVVEVAIRARAVQTSLVQVLRRPDEDAGFAADGGTQTTEIAARFRS